ncbi:MAG: regulatory iron-sulfur-containing complex subunit RicT [Bacteroidales bacterium]|nr:regulatory iron-sulfur-containing complex subunit RicT [Bacteroidales bacterium]
MDVNEKKEGCCSKHGTCPRCKYSSNKKLNVYDWLQDIPDSNDSDFVEVQFKNTRKGYFRNSNNVSLEKGDMVAVESNPGHDIGEVTLTGRLVLLQMKKNNVRLDNPDIRRVYRKVKPVDMEKYEEAKAKEHDTMLRARKIAEDLNLNMKIGDVEYQGDGNKAIFYYIADDRVDFRQLIKVLAENFRVRIEMKQIGARQEAGRIGGIGPCGRELCCSGWMTSFVSVATSAARYQDISLNPQKLAGQCAKLKCCLNYEVDTYVEAQKQLPSREIALLTKDGEYYHFKTDIHKRMISYSTNKDFPANLVTIPASRAFEIIALNKRGVKVDSLAIPDEKEEVKKEFGDIVGQDSLTRFDKSKLAKNKKRKKDNRGNQNELSEENSLNDAHTDKSFQNGTDEIDGKGERNLKPQYQNDKKGLRVQRSNGVNKQDNGVTQPVISGNRQAGVGNPQTNGGSQRSNQDFSNKGNNGQRPNDGSQQPNNGKIVEKNNSGQPKDLSATNDVQNGSSINKKEGTTDSSNRKFRKPPKRHFNKNRDSNNNDNPAKNIKPVQE